MKKLLAILLLFYPALAWGQTSPDQRPHAGQEARTNRQNVFTQNQTFLGTGNILGTIASGTWNGSVIGSSFGGAGSISGALKGNGSGTVSQAACGDLSNSGTACQAVAPANTTSTTHQFFNAYTSATGAFTKAQPACGDLSDSQTGCSTIVGTSATVNTGTSGATIPLNNGSNTASGSNIQSGAYAITGTSTPTQGSGTLGLAGTATKPTLAATSEGDIFLTAAGGINLIGDGSSFDFSLFNKSGTSVCTVATGTTNWNCTGLQVGGTAVSTQTFGTLTNTDWCTTNGTSISCATAPPVTTFSAGTTGLTPNSATTGAVTLAGTLVAANGGTGVSNTATLTLGSSNVNLASLATGIVKNTTTTGALTAAASADVIALFSACSGSQYLGADGSCHNASGAGTVTSITAGTGLTGGVISTSGTIAEDNYTLAVKTITAINIGGL